MTKTELKMALKLHHDWKVNRRRDYATLLMEYADGKILSMFESAISPEILFYHANGISDYEIDWHAVYISAVRIMSEKAKEVANGTL